MGMVLCADCRGSVSDEAKACVHCGKPLFKDEPGAIGIAVRVVYYVFTALVMLVGIFALVWSFRDGDGRGIIIALAGTVALWFVGSIASVVLLYVTRSERSRAIHGATLRE